MIYSPLIDPTSDSLMPALRRERTHPTHLYFQCASTSNLQKGSAIRGRLPMVTVSGVRSSQCGRVLLSTRCLSVTNVRLAAPTSHGCLSRHKRVMPVGPGSAASSTAPITGRRPHGTASTKNLTTPLLSYSGNSWHTS